MDPRLDTKEATKCKLLPVVKNLFSSTVYEMEKYSESRCL